MHDCDCLLLHVHELLARYMMVFSEDDSVKTEMQYALLVTYMELKVSQSMEFP